MFRLHIITAWRSLRKNRFFTAINVIGLSVASAAFFLLFNYIRYERGYENVHRNADNIYRVTLDLYEGPKYVVTDCETYPPMAPYFKMKYPEVSDFVRVQDMGDQEINAGNRAFRSQKIYASDPSILTVFDYKIIKGDPATALNAPGKIILNQTVSRKLFGDQDPVGQRLIFLGDPFEVSALMEDAPTDTHLRPEAIFPITDLAKRGLDLDSWSGNNNFLYLLMKPGTVLADFNAKLRDFSKERLKSEIAQAESMPGIHLHSNKTFEPDVNGDARSVNILLGVALLVILIGSANYVNLATARLAEKQRESALRKVLGSSRGALLAQYFTESGIITLLALALAAVLVTLAVPIYSGLVGEGATSRLWDPWFILGVAGLLFVSNLVLSGLYPAIVLSSVRASAITSRTFTGPGGNAFFRKILVVGQFAIALVVLSASVIIYQQMRFVKSRDLGMNPDQVLVVRGPSLSAPDSTRITAGRQFRQQLLQVPGVKNVSLAASLPGKGLHNMNTRTGIRRIEDTHKNGYNFYFYNVDENFIDVMSMKMAAGSNFSSNAPENNKTVLINEQAASLLGFASSEAAIGRRITLASDDPDDAYEVRGVLKDYQQQSLKESQIPMIHLYRQDITDLLAVKLHSTDMKAAVEAISRKWEQDYSGHMFDYFFMDEMYNRQYSGELRFGKILNIFAGFTLLITILGLLGLATYNAARRTREIGIRKVLGASSAGIIRLLSRDFLVLVLIAIVVAIPLCWIVANAWLQGFTYRITISVWVFVGTGLLVSLLAMLTIGVQGLRTALANPVTSLKSE